MTVNNIKALETNFVNALGAGRSATVHLYGLAVHAANSRDTTCMVNVMNRATKKGDDLAARIVKASIAALFPNGAFAGEAFKLNKSQHCDLFLAKLEKACEEKLSIRGAKFKAEVFGKAAKEYSLTDAAAAFVAKAVKNGHSHTAAIAAVKAVQVRVAA